MLVLEALGFGRESHIYIATREIFGGEERFSIFQSNFLLSLLNNFKI